MTQTDEPGPPCQCCRVNGWRGYRDSTKCGCTPPETFCPKCKMCERHCFRHWGHRYADKEAV